MVIIVKSINLIISIVAAVVIMFWLICIVASIDLGYNIEHRLNHQNTNVFSLFQGIIRKTNVVTLNRQI